MALIKKTMLFQTRNSKIVQELLQFEKQAIDILSEFEKLFNKITELGVKSFDEKSVEFCKNRIKEKQHICSNSVVDQLKLFLRINQQMYETEAKVFLEEFQKKEILYRNEIIIIVRKISEHVKLVEEDKLAKIQQQQKSM